MELIDFKEKLEQKQQGLNVTFLKNERTYLYGKYYDITGRVADLNCSMCDTYTFKILLNYLNQNSSIEDKYLHKYGKQVPNRYKNDKQWIESKL